MKLISKKDIIIPKGTVFVNIDDSTALFIYDNYDTIFVLDKDTSARIIVSSKNKGYFEEVK